MTPEELRRRNLEAALARMKMHDRPDDEEEDEQHAFFVPWTPKLLPAKPKKGDLLGWNLPFAPTTWEDESGRPILMSRWDPATRDYLFQPIQPHTTSTPTRGWDDEWLTWRDFTVRWDGAVPEKERFGTPGQSRGLLLEFYQSSKVLREAGVRIPTRDTTMPLNPVVPRKLKRGKHERED